MWPIHALTCRLKIPPAMMVGVGNYYTLPPYHLRINGELALLAARKCNHSLRVHEPAPTNTSYLLTSSMEKFPTFTNHLRSMHIKYDTHILTCRRLQQTLLTFTRFFAMGGISTFSHKKSDERLHL